MREICVHRNLLKAPLKEIYFGKKDIEQNNIMNILNTKLLRGWEDLNKDYSLEISNSTWEIRVGQS